MKKIVLYISVFLLSNHVSAQTDMAGAMKALGTAKPGDTIVVADNNYRDVEINFLAKGDAAKPIVIKAQTPGKVVVSGTSLLRLAGTGIEVNGFYFTNGYAPKGAVIEFRSGNEVANNCRITACAIDNFNPPSRETENSWVLMYGKNNRFDHNNIQGKLNNGVTLAVILDEERNIDNNHLVDHNYFGERPNLGSNGGETIRVGTSQSSLLSSRTRIENNLFEHCDGEVEVVSIKSCDNALRKNVFYECAGVLALRHGHRNIVDSNVFIGNGKEHTGGIRVINEGHTISNNRFYNLKGDRFFAALAVMNAVPNSLPNRYHQVKDVVIEGNQWINCDNIQLCVGKDNERTLPPANVLVKNNLFHNSRNREVFTAYDDISGFRFVNNKVVTQSKQYKKPGFGEIQLPIIADQKPVNRKEFGSEWYRAAERKERLLSGKIITVTPSQNSLAKAIETSVFGDVIELSAEGDYLLDKTVEVKTYLRIQAAKNLRTKPVIRYNGTKGKVAVFTIADNGILEMDGLAFNNDAFDGKAAANAAVSPAPVMRGHYGAFINNCEFYNFGESSFAPFKAQKTTYADTLIFTNCLFRDMSGDAIALAAEKDDAGKYSAEYVVVKNCAFYKVLGYAVDLYRGGSDESTTGPTIVVDHCVLEDVNNKERGSGMRLYGVQNVTVKNSIFSNTGRGGASIRFDEASWDKIIVTNCNMYNSGRVASFWGKVITGPMWGTKPMYRSFASYNFHQHGGSVLHGKATDGTSIGLITPDYSTPQKTTTKSTK
ncbi:MAG TPA: chondroitinase-B domain-containing protein [Flavisolibacter sp.]|nr:chondroitinase-B domain-containing protein [Flavisolibacter sp.]